MADEYILRSIAIAKLTALEVTDPFATIADAKRVLADMDAADVASVAHGKRGDNGIAGSMLVKCSVCDFDCGANSFSYCPNCGARMDGGKDNAEVVHEKWLLDRWPSWPHRECSRCKIMIPRTKEVPDQYWQYCPNCGARMDGGAEGE